LKVLVVAGPLLCNQIRGLMSGKGYVRCSGYSGAKKTLSAPSGYLPGWLDDPACWKIAKTSAHLSLLSSATKILLRVISNRLAIFFLLHRAGSRAAPIQRMTCSASLDCIFPISMMSFLACFIVYGRFGARYSDRSLFPVCEK
jgi:hypothetical protein